MPDSSESRERADPAKEAGLGQVSENKGGPVDKPEQQERDRGESERRRQISAGDETDQSEAVDPADAAAHGGHHETEAEATGQRRRGPEQPPGPGKGGR